MSIKQEIRGKFWVDENVEKELGENGFCRFGNCPTLFALGGVPWSKKSYERSCFFPVVRISSNPLSKHISSNCVAGAHTFAYTDKKETQIFLIYKKILNEAVAKSFMTNGLLIYGKIFAHFLIY